MKLSNIASNLTNLTGRTGILLKKFSPEILLIVGITGTVASSVMACRATLKVEGVLNLHKAKKSKINEAWTQVQSGQISFNEYTEKDRNKDLTLTYMQTTVDFIKLYGPAITLGTLSIGCIIGGHGIMKKRNVALVAAYKAIEDGFKAYRKRVIEEHGEETDYMYKNGLKIRTSY